jgi:ElaA protein
MATDDLANVRWESKGFAELSAFELYGILRLRSEVFVVEQHCIFLDADNKDQVGQHMMGKLNGNIVAYSRLFDAGLIYDDYQAIGRVCNSAQVRGNGIGRLLMEESCRECTRIFGPGPIKVSAQYYLKKFYESFGFKQSSEVYLEDDIEHICMIRN